jgi:hypothetical protein
MFCFRSQGADAYGRRADRKRRHCGALESIHVYRQPGSAVEENQDHTRVCESLTVKACRASLRCERAHHCVLQKNNLNIVELSA